MKTAAYMPLHYGKDYLGYAIKSIIDQIDKMIVLYTARPSYGHVSGKCPEGEEELRQIAEEASGGKLEWIKIRHTHMEGDHRNQAFRHVAGFDILAVIDSDEIWDPKAFEAALEYARNSAAFEIGANHQGWYHFWRSFNEYCSDGFCPIRFHNLKNMRKTQDINCPSKVYHFGYAQTRVITDYKWACHGHQDELRSNWFDEIFYGYQKGITKGLHPVSLQIWHEPTDFDRHDLPEFMHSHPFFNLEKIE